MGGRSLQISVHRLPEFASVKLSGPVTLDDYLRLIATMAEESRRLQDQRMLVDQLGIEGDLKFTDHFRIGEEVARHLQHLEKLASVVPGDKITHTSEKVALRQGMQLRVFTSLNGDPLAARARRAARSLSHVSLQRPGTSFATLAVRNPALSEKEIQWPFIPSPVR